MNMDSLMFWKLVLWGAPVVGIVLSSWANFNIFNIERSIKSSQEVEELARAVLNWSDYSGGSRASYENLVAEKNKVKTSLVVEKLRIIENNYSSATMALRVESIPAIWKVGSTPNNVEWEPIEGYNASNVVAHLSAKLWVERAKAACLLQRLKTAKNKEKINKEKLIDTLVTLMDQRNESSLVVSKMALSAYSDLTDFIPSSVFDFEGAIKDWKNPIRKTEVLKIDLENNKETQIFR